MNPSVLSRILATTATAWRIAERRCKPVGIPAVSHR